MSIDLNGRKVWVTEYQHDGQSYGDINWKEEIKALMDDQEYVLVEGRYGKHNNDFNCNIKGFPFSLITKEEFLKKLDKIKVGFTEDVYLYDALKNANAIWRKDIDINEYNRYIFIFHSVTDYQMT